MMFATRVVILHLATFYVVGVSAATIEKVTLVGTTDNYINVQSTSPYTLKCNYRAGGYDDTVSTVNWYKNKYLVYTWNKGELTSSAFRELNGFVQTTSKPNLQDINFTQRLSLDLSGNYTCEVISAKEKVTSQPFHLVILDISSNDFKTNVSLMREKANETNNALSFHDNSTCTLMWQFKTPAIFPRPNVTCGYYSYLHDDVTNQIPAGLAMQLLPNGSWQAGFENTHVQVSDIPRERRLGCSVKIPDTSFKKVVKFEDNFAIDHLIDSQGCPSMFLDQMHKIVYSIDGGALNCRGDLVPTSSDQPLKATFRCAPGDFAMFHNGTAVSYWSVQMTCDSKDMLWRQQHDGLHSQPLNISEFIPKCVPNSNNGFALSPSMPLFYFAILLLCFGKTVC